MHTDRLGAFEELVLLAVASLHGEAYAVSIQQCLEEEAGRQAALGATYTALNRLEQKGFVQSAMGEVSHRRGGKRKRYYQITDAGGRALIQVRDARERLWAQWRTRPDLGLSS